MLAAFIEQLRNATKAKLKKLRSSKKASYGDIDKLQKRLTKLTVLVWASRLWIVVLGAFIGIAIAGIAMYFTMVGPSGYLNQLFNQMQEETENEDAYEWGTLPETDTGETGGTGGSVVLDERANLLKVLDEEVAYYESTFTTLSSQHSDGWRRYVGWMHSNDSKSYEYWCADFVTYCVTKAGLTDYDIDGNDISNPDDPQTLSGVVKGYSKSFTSCTSGWYPYLEGMGFESTIVKKGDTIDVNNTKIQPGDIILFSDTGVSGSFCHIGFVYGFTSDGKVITVEGNTGYTGCSSCNGHLQKKDGTHTTADGRKIGTMGNGTANYYPYVQIYHIPYKVVYGSGGGAGTANFSMDNYTKGSDGYYTPEEVQRAVYDFCVAELGMNSAGAIGVMANLSVECSFKYDMMEVPNKPLYYISGSTIVSQVPDGTFTYPSGGLVNGNYDMSDPKCVIFYNNVLSQGGREIGYINSEGNIQNYGIGFGLVQWSFNRRFNLINKSTDSSWQYGITYGPDGLFGQLMFMKYELENSYPNTYQAMLDVENTQAGAVEAAAIWEDNYEIGHSRQERLDRAKAMWNDWGNREPTPPPATSNPSGGSSNLPSVDISKCLIIGDSNTVRMNSYTSEIPNALDVCAIVGVSTKGWDSYTNDSNTTGGKTLKAHLDSLSDGYFQHVVIMLGTNDYGSDSATFKTSYTEILDYIKTRNSKAVVNLVTVPPVNDAESPYIKNTDANRLAGDIKAIAQNYQGLTINLIDLNSHLSVSDMSTSSSDGYHLKISEGCEKASAFIASNVK